MAPPATPGTTGLSLPGPIYFTLKVAKFQKYFFSAISLPLGLLWIENSPSFSTPSPLPQNLDKNINSFHIQIFLLRSFKNMSNSQRIPKELPKNSKRTPKEFPRNSQRTPKGVYQRIPKIFKISLHRT